METDDELFASNEIFLVAFRCAPNSTCVCLPIATHGATLKRTQMLSVTVAIAMSVGKLVVQSLRIIGIIIWTQGPFCIIAIRCLL